ncbi:MAG TPA: poly-beta-1,6-N-acetyl-D-glucosamine N-deacetylase PgaB [Burkholderiales bacterium]|nr:poly-beta-1,6-N-acetyl-D-glucosamine N-deacetylase PgaB [Burkholderiales bacterium]
MRRLLLLLLLTALPADAALASSFRVLCYHDVQEDVRVRPDPFAVDTAELVSQFAWLKENGYHVVGLDDVIAAREGRRPLPDKAIVLTFDDGYSSVYTRVFPLLKLFGYPAIIALSGHWLEAAGDNTVEYGGVRVSRDEFVTWEQVREMTASGLVEVASHSYDLHRGATGNPQGNQMPSAVVYRYDNGKYEDDAAHAARVRADLSRNSALIKAKTGKAPRLMIWPFGRDSGDVIEIARKLGMPYAMNLSPGGTQPESDLARMHRDLIADNPPLSDFIDLVRKEPRPVPQRVVHVDLDYVFDKDPVQQQKNLDALVNRIRALRVTAVYLQAYSDPDGNGTAAALYFPNRHLPVRADLFSYAAWQLKTRAEVNVYAWMPVLAFDIAGNSLAGEVVKSADPGAATSGRYHRLSPFSAAARNIIGEIYADLARHARIDGLLFHDDATLDDFEDVSDAGKQALADWGLPQSIDAIRADPVLMQRWTRNKSEALTAFTHELVERVRRYQGAIKTARNLYALPVMDPATEPRFAQSLPDFLAAYDFAALMAMPLMEGATKPDAWLDRLVRTVAAQPEGLAKTVFELQSVNWNTRTPVSTETLATQLRNLQLRGALNIGYYPDDFIHDRPELARIKPALSLQIFPRKD